MVSRVEAGSDILGYGQGMGGRGVNDGMRALCESAVSQHKLMAVIRGESGDIYELLRLFVIYKSRKEAESACNCSSNNEADVIADT